MGKSGHFVRLPYAVARWRVIFGERTRTATASPARVPAGGRHAGSVSGVP